MLERPVPKIYASIKPKTEATSLPLKFRLMPVSKTLPLDAVDDRMGEEEKRQLDLVETLRGLAYLTSTGLYGHTWD